MSDPLLDSPLVRSIGWALVNSIWQGTLIGGGTALALRALSGARANARYSIACAALFLMLVVPFSSLFGDGAQNAAGVVASAAAARGIVTYEPVQRVLPLAVLAWVVGVVLLSARLAAACLGIERMKRATRDVDEKLFLRLRSIAHRLGVQRSVRILESSVVAVPTVVGCLRPVILLPASVVTGLPAAHLDAVLAHELAHVRRYDYFVNVMQSIIETLLFYHPAVWWCSRQVRIEREHCCDDLVVEACGDRVGYATALAQLEELRGLKPMLSMNVTGGRLLDRIRRVLKQSPVNDDRSTTWMIAPALALIAVAIILTPVLTTADAEMAAGQVRSDRALPAPPLPPRAPETPAPAPPAPPALAPAAPVPPPPPALPVDPAPAAPAAPPAPPMPPDIPLPPEPPAVPDVPEIAEELNRAAAELLNGFDEMRRATQDIARQQLQLAQTQAALEKMKADVLAKNADIEAMRKVIAELAANHAALGAQRDLPEMRKQIDAIRQELQKLRAK